MTNFNSATKSFDLCAQSTESYAWAWENLDRADCVGDMNLAGKAPEQFARDWANTLLKASIDQINPEGERGFTAEEIKADLHDDVQYLATALQAWLEEGDEPTDEPTATELYSITHPIMGEWDEPATVDEIGGYVAQWDTRGAEYSIRVDLDKVYVYVELDELNVSDGGADGDYWVIDSDFNPSSDNWVKVSPDTYRLEIGELHHEE